MINDNDGNDTIAVINDIEGNNDKSYTSNAVNDV